MSISAPVQSAIARVNGVALNAPDESLSEEILRQRACSELLRQAAIKVGLLSASDVSTADGVLSEAAAEAIELLLDQNLNTDEPSDEACRRHYAAHTARYSSGERVRVRHILFAVTEGVDVVSLRNRAETAMLDVRCHDDGDEDKFADAAGILSNCPSGAEGGDLGWLTRADCAPEFAKEIFGHAEIGVLPRLVHSRFGLHVVEVLARDPGVVQPYEAVQDAVALSLQQQADVTALRQYMRGLADEAVMEGVGLE